MNLPALLSRFHVDSNSGCWLWDGPLDPNGYTGKLVVEGRRTHAHRAVYLYQVGPIPDGLELDHLCRTPRCVNPAHLEPVTHQENMRRARMNRKTHCLRGHLLDDPGNIPAPNGRWLCRACSNLRMRQYRLRKKRSSRPADLLPKGER